MSQQRTAKFGAILQSRTRRSMRNTRGSLSPSSTLRRRLFRFLSLLVALVLTHQHTASRPPATSIGERGRSLATAARDRFAIFSLDGQPTAAVEAAVSGSFRSAGLMHREPSTPSNETQPASSARNRGMIIGASPPPSRVPAPIADQYRAARALDDATSSTASGSGTSAASNSGTTESIFTRGDLILVNPIQSTSIFFAVIVCSTALERLIDHAATQGNAYLRNIVTSIREEMTCIAVAQMLLLLFAITAPISGTAVSVTLVAILTMVFMCILFALFVVVLALVQSRRGLTWAGFEWSQLNNDALHSPQQRLFKLGRTIFFFRAGLDPEVAEAQRAVEAASGDVTSALPVLFAVYVNFIERRYLACSSDFTWLTWVAVIGVVILDGLRSITINSLKLDSDPAAIAQCVSFVVFVGYGITAAAAICLVVQRMRIRKYLYEYTNAAPMRRCATAAAEPIPVDDAAALRQRRALLKLPAAEGPRLNAGTGGCLFFGSVEGSLGTFKALVLAAIWYTALFLVCFISLSFTAAGPAAVVLLLFGLLPFGLIVGYFYPTAVGDMIICCSVGSDFDPLLVAGVADGTVDLRDVDADPDTAAAAVDGWGGPLDDFNASHQRGGAAGVGGAGGAAAAAAALSALLAADGGANASSLGPDGGARDAGGAGGGSGGRRRSPFMAAHDGGGDGGGGGLHAAELEGEWDLPPGDVTLSGIPTGAPAAPSRIHGVAPGGPSGNFIVLPQRILFDRAPQNGGRRQF